QQRAGQDDLRESQRVRERIEDVPLEEMKRVREQLMRTSAEDPDRQIGVIEGALVGGNQRVAEAQRQRQSQNERGHGIRDERRDVNRTRHRMPADAQVARTSRRARSYAATSWSPYDVHESRRAVCSAAAPRRARNDGSARSRASASARASSSAGGTR